MADAIYSVIPVQGGWAVEQPSGNYLMFLSGGLAEAKAHELALRDSRTGITAWVMIHDRDRTLLGEREYPARQPPDIVGEHPG